MELPQAQYRRITIDVKTVGDGDLYRPGMFMLVVKKLVDALPFVYVQHISNDPYDPNKYDANYNPWG